MAKFDFFAPNRRTELSYSPLSTYEDSTKPSSLKSALKVGIASTYQSVPVDEPYVPQTMPYVVDSYVASSYVENTV